LTLIDLGRQKLTLAALVTRCAQRMLIENNISESVQFFHMDALCSMVGLKVDFDLQLMLMAGSLYRLMARRIGREYESVPRRIRFGGQARAHAVVRQQATPDSLRVRIQAFDLQADVFAQQFRDARHDRDSTLCRGCRLVGLRLETLLAGYSGLGFTRRQQPDVLERHSGP
jgi:hypothetical protein